jgi:hypothetical protein
MKTNGRIALAFTRHSGKSKSGFIDEVTKAGFKCAETENQFKGLQYKITGRHSVKEQHPITRPTIIARAQCSCRPRPPPAHLSVDFGVVRF